MASPLSIEDFTLTKRLASGKYGKVYRCFRKSDDRCFAVKVQRRTELLRQNVDFTAEARLHAAAAKSSPYVIGLEVAFDDESRHYLLLEHAARGDLYDFIQRWPIPTTFIQRWMRQIAEALVDCSRVGILHRDIKPENILITGQWQARLADFGHSCNAPTSLQQCGTLDYLCPQKAAGRLYDSGSDVWAFGVVLYECCCGELPFTGLRWAQTYANIQAAAPPYPATIPLAAQDLLKRIFVVDPAHRIPLAALLQHPFLSITLP